MPQISNRPVSSLAFAPEPDAAGSAEPPLSDDVREALLRRIEMWIEEEERLIAEIERRFAAAGNVLAFSLDRPSPRDASAEAPSPARARSGR
jgi:hypothetical protein